MIAGWELGKPEPLDDYLLDLIHLVPGYAGTMRADWMLPIVRDRRRSSAEPRLDASNAGVLAALRLPKRALAPSSRRQIGPVHFDGQTNHRLDFATLWHAEMFASQALVVIRDLQSMKEVRTIPVDGHGTTIRLTIRNRTKAEHEHPGKPTKKGEKLREFGDILTLANSSQGIPVYEGENLDEGTRQGATSLAITVADPFRLCPQGYCEDCPDD